MPHGTVVRINTRDNQINVGIVASPYDLHNTEGLCGYYDGNVQNDLLLADGSVYSRPLSKKRGATAFSYSWR